MNGTLSGSMCTTPVSGRLIARAYGAWLSTFHWDHVATLTFGEPVNVDRAQRRFRRWIRWLEKSARQRVDYAVFAERSWEHGPVHLHALVHGTAQLTARDLERAWHHGHTHIRVYDSRRGAVYYVAKGLNTDPDWHDVSAKLCPCVGAAAAALVSCM